MDLSVALALCAIFGVVIGSFLTVVVDRVPDERSIVQPPSACGACGHRLGPRDLVPVVSWVLLGGKCRYCKHPIGAQAIAIELTTAALFMLMAWRFNADPRFIAYCILCAGLVALTWIDLDHMRLPREVSYTTAVIGGVALIAIAFVRSEQIRLVHAAGGAVLATLLMLAIYLASRGGMGDGDVRMAPLFGLFLGYLDVRLVPLAIFLAAAVGAIVGLAAMAFGSAGRKTAVPFGPFLAAGTILAVVFGDAMLDLLFSR